MRFTFLGGFHVADTERSITRFGGDKVRALLVYLTIEADRPHARIALAALLWPDLSDDLALRNLAQSLVRLRTALGDEAQATLTITRQSIQWRADAEVDVTTFLRLARSTTLADLEAVAALYNGEFLPGFGLAECEVFEEWLLLTREHLHQQMLAVLEQLADRYHEASQYKAAAGAARRQLALDPWRETACRQLMRALAAIGDSAGALAAYERCRQALHDDLQAAPDPTTRMLAAQIRNDQVHPEATFARAVELPAPLTPLVGREEDLAMVNALLRHNARLVTVLGPGGVGKTRLALAAAYALRDAFPDGVWWIELAGVSSMADQATQHDHILDAILGALTDQQRGQRTLFDELCLLIRGRALLMVLDNCEHLSASGAVIHALLAANATLRILATSRERLGIYGEQLLTLDGLPVSSVDQDDTHSAAVQLFLNRAQHQVRTFGGDLPTLEAIVRLCRLLEGMPLGIELAAHWVGDYTPDEIAAAVRADLTFLETRDHYGLDRHRSLRAVFDYSWNLLTSDERRILAHVSVFAIGFDRTAALHVAQARPATLAALVDKSLLRRVSAGRYNMHELLRQFSAEQLDRIDGARAAVEARHSTFYLNFVAARAQRLMREQPREAAAEIQAELDNVRYAWTWAVAHACVADLGGAVNGLYQFYAVTGQAAEREQALEAASHVIRRSIQQHPDDKAGLHTLGTLLALYATGLAVQSKHQQAISVAQEAITFGQWSPEGEILAHFAWGRTLYRLGQILDARTRIEHTISLVVQYPPNESASDMVGVIEWASYTWLGIINMGLSEYDQARENILHGLLICQAQNRRLGEVDSLRNLANVARIVYDLPTARMHYQRALQLAPNMSSRSAEGIIKLELGNVVRLQGEYTHAHDLITGALAILREIDETPQEYVATALMVCLVFSMGDDVRAAMWYTRYTELKESIESPEAHVTALLAIHAYICHIGNGTQALEAAEQCWDLAHRFSNTYDQAEALLMIGHARASLGIDDAVSAYQQALELYVALNNPGLAAEAWAGLAAVMLDRGDLPHARTCVENVLQTIADYARIGLDEPFDVYLICYRVLKATDDQRAEHILQTAHRELLRWTAAIVDPADRQRFVHNVASHRDISALATREVERMIAR